MTTIFTHNPMGFSDPSDDYANQKALYLSFYHIASKQSIAFKAFLTDYGETFTSDYNSEPVFGRMDPIMTYRNTTRKVRVAWDIPAASLSEAKENMRRCNRLAEFMYPAYDVKPFANTLSKPPLMKIRFANLIRGSGDSPEAEIGGLLAAVGSISVTPVLDTNNVFDPNTAELYPQMWRISCDFTPLHQHSLGWGGEGNTFGDGEWFPWGIPGERPPVPVGANMEQGPPTPPEDPAVPRSDKDKDSAQQLADAEEAASAGNVTDFQTMDEQLDEELDTMVNNLQDTSAEISQMEDDIIVDNTIRRWQGIREGQAGLDTRSDPLQDALGNLSVLDEGMAGVRTAQQRLEQELFNQSLNNRSDSLQDGTGAINEYDQGMAGVRSANQRLGQELFNQSLDNRSSDLSNYANSVPQDLSANDDALQQAFNDTERGAYLTEARRRNNARLNRAQNMMDTRANQAPPQGSSGLSRSNRDRLRNQGLSDEDINFLYGG
jgi:hypothetical protein